MASKMQGVGSSQDQGNQALAPAPERDPWTKSCSCTGVRWCAACRSPKLRAAWNLRPPIAEPAFLSHSLQRPVRAGPTVCGSEVHVFDAAAQCAPTLPEFTGVHVVHDFVSEGEATALLAEIGQTPFALAQSGKLKQHFGPKMNFRKRKMNPVHFDGLPRYGHWIEERLREHLASSPGANRLDAAMVRYITTDVFVLRYLERECSNLDVHIDDTHAYGEVILDLSLESDGWLTFLDRDPMNGLAEPFICVRVPMPARSLLVLFGPARSAWFHGVAARDIRGQRTSITLRTLGEAFRETEDGRLVLERAAREAGDGVATVVPSHRTRVASMLPSDDDVMTSCARSACACGSEVDGGDRVGLNSLEPERGSADSRNGSAHGSAGWASHRGPGEGPPSQGPTLGDRA